MDKMENKGGKKCTVTVCNMFSHLNVQSLDCHLQSYYTSGLVEECQHYIEQFCPEDGGITFPSHSDTHIPDHAVSQPR